MSMFSLKLLCLLSCFLSCSPLLEVKVKTGKNATLTCQGPTDADIKQLEWTKADLESDDYVFFFRDKQTYDNYQLSSFHGRVKLRDPEMTNGNVDVILSNVTDYDAGTYECYVGKTTSERRKRSAPELINSIRLVVEDHITAKSGQRVVLSCNSNGPVTDVEWKREDLIKAGDVFISTDGKHISDKQHPYFKNWVELKDTEMENGDISLVLKEAMTVDSGIYECYDTQGKRRKIRSVTLTVEPGPSRDGKTTNG
ncbi:butyrophilin subfamily 2 member A2-like [Betta splendens]|uniref:Butyrophilin subfamily 2 member A2-like n=1 Tax=Betta splendens TaxID=158456 RepID=A0A6P7LY07_BETSP|nr:butyrophilin subfamily 2 member A2-like [Betta splendens]